MNYLFYAQGFSPHSGVIDRGLEGTGSSGNGRGAPFADEIYHGGGYGDGLHYGNGHGGSADGFLKRILPITDQQLFYLAWVQGVV